MKVILRSDVEKVGRAGEVKQVSDGFGRNFLFPKRLAVPATEAALQAWERGKEKRARLVAEKTAQARALAERLATVALSFSRPAGAEGKLFGSVGRSDIVKSLRATGFELEGRCVQLDEALKTVGEHEVAIKLLPDIGVKIKVTVSARE